MPVVAAIGLHWQTMQSRTLLKEQDCPATQNWPRYSAQMESLRL